MMSDSEEEEQTVDFMEEDDDLESTDYSSHEEPLQQAKPYTTLEPQQLEDKINETASRLGQVIGVSLEDAKHVLLKYKWEVRRASEEWFQDEGQVAEAVGITATPRRLPSKEKQQVWCSICYEHHGQGTRMMSAGCNHFFCKQAWQGYISAVLKEKALLIADLRCPEQKCTAYVPWTIIEECTDPEEQGRARAFFHRSVVEASGNMTFCPGADCDRVVELADARRAQQDVRCRCGTHFCFSCKEDAHRPVDCDTVRKWLHKNQAESENTIWILANTKNCPKCHRPIEKNQGCMHMTCSQCRHEFCWLCLGRWDEHGDRTGGYYQCNKYEAAKKRGDYNEEIRKRQNAKQALERYTHYFERYNSHLTGRRTAQEVLQHKVKPKLDQLGEKVRTPVSQLRFICEAWDQVCECRRVLQWTYAYGYYAFEDVDENTDLHIQKRFFEYQQGQAEGCLEVLHGQLEKELLECYFSHREFEDTNGFPAELQEEFWKWKHNLLTLTDVTSRYFNKLVEGLEKGLHTMMATEELQHASSDLGPIVGGSQTQYGDMPSSSRAVR